MSGSESKNREFEGPDATAVDQLTAVSEALPHAVRSVTKQLNDLGLESRVLRNGWVIYAVDLLGPDVAVRPARADGAPGPCLTACAVWEISEGGYRWVRPLVEQLDKAHPDIDFSYVPEKGTVWATRSLGSAELSAEQILEAMWELADACADAWRQIAALGLGKRFHSAWLCEDLMSGDRTLAQMRRESLAAAGAGAASANGSSNDSAAGPGTAAAA